MVIGAYGMPRQFQYYWWLFTVTFVVAFSIFTPKFWKVGIYKWWLCSKMNAAWVEGTIKKSKTRMHSSRMRPSCSLAVFGGVPGLGGCTWSWGGVPGPGVVYLVPGGVPGLGGCTWSWGVYLWTPCEQNHRRLQKTLPLPNFVAAGKNHTFLKMTLRSIVYSKTSLKYFLWFDRLTSFKIMYRINNLPVFLYLAITGTERPGWLVLVLVASRRCPRRWWWWLNFRSITLRRGWLIRRNISDGLLMLASRTCSWRHWWWLIHRRIPWRLRQLS